MISYNKSFQQKLKIDIKNYKRYKNKYISYEFDNKAKIFDAENERLIFEGYLLNGKKNGIGREYDKYGDLLFEG